MSAAAIQPQLWVDRGWPESAARRVPVPVTPPPQPAADEAVTVGPFEIEEW